MPNRWFAALLPAALLAASGCTGGGKSAAPEPTVTYATQPTPSASPCPQARPTSPRWPTDVPPELPLPDTATITKSERTTGNLRVVHFNVPWSLRESILFVVNRYPQAGFRLGRGDAEVTEADAPFEKDDLRGLVRIFLTGDCKTLWLLAVGRSDSQVPLNQSYSPRPSASSLPFG